MTSALLWSPYSLLQALRIGAQVGQGGRSCLTPMVKYVGNMHGNEVHGREMILRLAKELLEKYSSGADDIRDLLDHTDIHLLPTMNPDGFSRCLTTSIHFLFSQREKKTLLNFYPGLFLVPEILAGVHEAGTMLMGRISTETFQDGVKNPLRSQGRKGNILVY